MMRQMRWGALTVTLLGMGIGQAQAQVVYSQNFDTGSATFTVNDPFWTDPNRANGFITKTTNTPTIWPGAPGEFGNSIPQDVSGNGYYLFEGTFDYSAGNPIIPAGSDQYFISPMFAVAPTPSTTSASI
jgi:hypothetical protein